MKPRAWVRAAVSVALLLYLLSRTDLHAIGASVAGADRLWLLAGLATHVPGYLISGLRWRLLLAAAGVPVPLRYLISSYLVGTFFNQFLPTTLGGDVYRVYDLARYGAGPIPSAAAVLVERLSGMLALVLIGIVALAAGGPALRADPLVWSSAAVLAAGLVAMTALFVPAVARRARDAVRKTGRPRLEERLSGAYETVRAFWQRPGALAAVLLLGVALQVNVVLQYYFIALALRLPVGLLAFLMVVPVVLVILMAPVTINGIGLRENAFALYLARFGVDAARAVTLSWISYAYVLLYGIAGGLVYILRREAGVPGKSRGESLG